MEIVITGRRTDVPERFRQLADEKLVKITQFAPRAHRVDVELSHERNPRQAEMRKKVEITVRGKGPVVRAEACAAEPLAAFDLAFGKLLERLRRLGDRRKVHHGRHAPASVRMPLGSPPGAELPRSTPARGIALADTAPLGATLPPGTPAADGAVHDVADTDDTASAAEDVTTRAALEEGEHADGPLVIRTKDHPAVPMTLDQALYEMELVGHDFFLFVEATTGRPCVVYRRHGYHYGVIRLQVPDASEVGAGDEIPAPVEAGAR